MEMIEVVSAVITRNGRILLTQRREDKDYPFAWECPGGKVKGNESHHEALSREIGEELGADTRAIGPSSVWCGKVTDKIFLLMYRLDLAYSPTLREMQPGMGWFTPEEMKHLTLTPGNAMALPALLRLRELRA
jgi:8-oxo-dGTP pyrophosphatase MutT (NUDIX family)